MLKFTVPRVTRGIFLRYYSYANDNTNDKGQVTKDSSAECNS